MFLLTACILNHDQVLVQEGMESDGIVDCDIREKCMRTLGGRSLCEV